MTINLVRVINQQTLPQGLSRDGSILLDKIDRSQGNSENPPYAQLAKQKVYVPYANPLNLAVKGYVDLVPTDDVLLACEAGGSIAGLFDSVPVRVTIATVASNLVATPVASGVTNANPSVITGTTFTSVAPDLTYVEITNLAGVTQLIPQSDFSAHSATSISILDAVVTGVPTSGWKFRVFANSKWSNQVTVP